MNRVPHMTRSQLRRRAKLYIAIWISWLFVGSWVAMVMPPHLDVPALFAVMIPFVLAGRCGIQMWAASRTAPDLPVAINASALRARRGNR